MEDEHLRLVGLVAAQGQLSGQRRGDIHGGTAAVEGGDALLAVAGGHGLFHQPSPVAAVFRRRGHGDGGQLYRGRPHGNVHRGGVADPP